MPAPDATLLSVVPIVLAIVSGIVAQRMAENRGRDPMVWAVLGFAFSFVAVFTLWRLPPVWRRRTPR